MTKCPVLRTRTYLRTYLRTFRRMNSFDRYLFVLQSAGRVHFFHQQSTIDVEPFFESKIYGMTHTVSLILYESYGMTHTPNLK